MKAVNAYYRKHKTLDGCPHLPPEELEKLKADMASSLEKEKAISLCHKYGVKAEIKFVASSELQQV